MMSESYKISILNKH